MIAYRLKFVKDRGDVNPTIKLVEGSAENLQGVLDQLEQKEEGFNAEEQFLELLIMKEV